MIQFTYTSTSQQVIFGARALAQLGPATADGGWKRLLLCTSPSQLRTGAVDVVAQTLGDRLQITYAIVQSHVLDSQLEEVLALAERHAVDAVAGLGGGSCIGMAKAASFELAARRAGAHVETARDRFAQPAVPGIAIPTTYAGSEMTPVYGVTRRQPDGSTRKVTVRDVRVTPRLVIYDPLLTIDLPPAVTAGTGINALAHCIEALYSTTANPLASAAALRGIHTIVGALERCFLHGDDLDARDAMLAGAHLGGVALSTVKMGLHHGICHVLGGTANIPHGIANAIVLPHAMRFNLDTTAPVLAQAAVAMGLDTRDLTDEEAGAAAVACVQSLIGRLGLPRRLREAGVARAMLPLLAQHIVLSQAVRDNPKAVPNVESALAFLDAAW